MEGAQTAQIWSTLISNNQITNKFFYTTDWSWLKVNSVTQWSHFSQRQNRGVFAPDSASVTPGSYPVRVVMRPGLMLLSWCSLCPPAHSVLSRGRPPIDTVHAPPWFMSHLSRLMFLSPKTGCSRLAFCTALRGHCLGMPRSTVIKLHQVGTEWSP